MTFSEPVTVEYAGPIHLQLAIGPDPVEVLLTDGNGTDTLLFSLIVPLDYEGPMSLHSNQLALNGSEIKNAEGVPFVNKIPDVDLSGIIIEIE